jgi:hypothetical protein
MPPHRPTSVLVIAILNMVLGGLGTLLMPCGFAALLINPYLQDMAHTANPNMPRQPQPPPALMGWSLASMAVMFVLAVGLLAAGIGLVKMRPWARRWTVALAVLGIALIVASPILNVTVLAEPNRQYMESMADWQRQMTGGQSMDMGGMMKASVYFGYVVAVVELIYAGVVLTVMLLPANVAAFAAAERQRVEKADEF